MEDKWKIIQQKARTDKAFRKKVLEDPLAVAKEYKIPVPKGISVKVHENTKKEMHFVLPSLESGEISEEDLRMLAAGKDGGGGGRSF